MKLPLSVALLALVLTACGGAGTDDSASSSTTGTETTTATTTTTTTTAAVDCSVDPLVWDCDIQEFFVSYCVECHSSQPRNFNRYNQVVDDADGIQCGVAPVGSEPATCGAWPPPEQFPVGSGPMPSTDERQMIVDWIDAGMP